MINYDPSVLSAVQIGNNGISLSNINDSLSTMIAAQTDDQNHPGKKKIMFVWYSLNGTYLDTSIKLCDIPFRYLGGTGNWNMTCGA